MRKKHMCCATIAALLACALLAVMPNQEVTATKVTCRDIFINQTTIPDLGYATIYMTLYNPTSRNITINLDKFNFTAYVAKGSDITGVEYYYWGDVIKQDCRVEVVNPTPEIPCWEQIPVQCYQVVTCGNYTDKGWARFNDGSPDITFPSQTYMDFKVIMYHNIVLGEQAFDWTSQVMTEELGLCKEKDWK